MAGMCITEETSSSTTTATRPPGTSSSSASASTTLPDPDTGPPGTSESTSAVLESTGPGTTDTGPAESSGEPIQRVTEGLLVLYPLDEGRGTVAYDQSGVGMPLDLAIEGDLYAWASDGIVLEDAILRGIDPATKILDGCQATDELTAEAWVTPLTSDMEGPGRIITLSEDAGSRSFTLGQGLHLMPSSPYIARLRTGDKTGDPNGSPQLFTMDIAMPVLTHLAYVRSTAGYDRIYVDGQIEAEGPRTGDFSTWDSLSEFACGNEITLDRPWQGTLHLVAVYDRALTEEEIAQNIAAGF